MELMDKVSVLLVDDRPEKLLALEAVLSDLPLDLVRAYYQLDERPRRRLLDLAKSLHGESEGR